MVFFLDEVQELRDARAEGESLARHESKTQKVKMQWLREVACRPENKAKFRTYLLSQPLHTTIAVLGDRIIGQGFGLGDAAKSVDKTGFCRYDCVYMFDPRDGLLDPTEPY